MNRSLVILCIYLFAINGVVAQEISEWRGPGRTGVYDETDLMKQWPENGPELIWSLSDLPKGYSSVSIANNTIFFTGLVDSVDVVIAVGFDGKIKWKKPYGKAWNSSYAFSRCTPTIEGDRMYLSSGYGDVVCMSTLNGDIFWKVKAHDLFEGTYGKWGISESLLVLDDKVIYTPGGEKTTIVALDKRTGQTLWMSESLKDKPSYVSPLLIEQGGKKLIVTLTENNVIGVQPNSGKILWSFNYGVYAGGKWNANIQANTPLYHDGRIFITNGYDHKSVMLNLADDLNAVSIAWIDSVLDVHHGGALLLDGFVYGANWETNRMGRWVCLDWSTGEIKYEKEWENKGSVISADGMLYCYDEKSGNIALVDATPEDFKIVSTFKVPYGQGPHWSHLVIDDGILYVRHGDALMAYAIKSSIP